MTRGVVLAGIVLCAVPAPGYKHSSAKSFHARALQICAHYGERQKHLSGRAALRQSVVLLRSEVRALRGLRPPPGRKATYRRWLTAMDDLAAELEREGIVVDRDEARVEAALRREKVKDWKPTRGELEHPTSAILSHTLAPLPEWDTFLRDVHAVLRRSKAHGLQVLRLGRRLALQDCFR